MAVRKPSIRCVDIEPTEQLSSVIQEGVHTAPPGETPHGLVGLTQRGLTARLMDDWKGYRVIYDTYQTMRVREDVNRGLKGVKISSIEVYSSLDLLNNIVPIVSYLGRQKNEMAEAKIILRLGSISGGLLLKPSFYISPKNDIRVHWKHYTLEDVQNWKAFTAFLFEKELQRETLETLASAHEGPRGKILYHLWINRKIMKDNLHEQHKPNTG